MIPTGTKHDPMDTMTGTKHDPDMWFEHTYGPPGAGDRHSVSDYASDPPRGMNNPPMNLKLRKILHEDLVEYGLELQVSNWKEAFVPHSAPPSPSQPGTFTPTARAMQSRAHLMHTYTENLRTGRTLKKGSVFSRSAPAITGRRGRRADWWEQQQKEEETPPLHPDWHQYHPYPWTLRPIDRRGPVSLVRTLSSSDAMKDKRTVRFAEDSKKTLEEHLTQGPSPLNTEFIKTPSHKQAIELGKKMTLDPTGKRTEAPGMAKKGKDSGKDGPTEEGKKKFDDDEHVDNTELDNSMLGLRGMSQLHKAAVADRFRFGASAARGEPMVLKASCLASANPGTWASDAAYLNKFHNRAVRIVKPSGLEMLKEPTSKRKKKKKAKEEEDELKMSDSGLFVARYPIDEALRKLRRMRKKAFPEEKDDLPKGPTQEELAAAAAAKLRLEFGGLLLSRVRESEEEQKEQEKAVAGYERDAM